MKINSLVREKIQEVKDNFTFIQEAKKRGMTEQEFENDILVDFALKRMKENNGTTRVTLDEL